LELKRSKVEFNTRYNTRETGMMMDDKIKSDYVKCRVEKQRGIKCKYNKGQFKQAEVEAGSLDAHEV
jgi:hypothetical protein